MQRARARMCVCVCVCVCVYVCTYIEEYFESIISGDRNVFLMQML
jgi:hypothetical protein